jgi:hypothetical protein
MKQQAGRPESNPRKAAVRFPGQYLFGPVILNQVIFTGIQSNTITQQKIPAGLGVIYFSPRVFSSQPY